MDLPAMLEVVVNKGASDLFISVGAPAMMKIEGKVERIDAHVLDGQTVSNMIYGIMNDDQRRAFDATMELNMPLKLGGVGRFRVNVFRQQGELALVARHVKAHVPSIESLGLPPLLHELIMEERGLILLVVRITP